MAKVFIKIIRSDSKEFLIDGIDWKIPSETGLDGFGLIEYEISSTANALGDGSYISNVRASAKDFTIHCVSVDPKQSEILRNKATSFFNGRFTFKVYLTYMSKTRWFEGYLHKFKLPTKNVNRKLDMTMIFTAAMPYLKSVDEFGRDIAAVQAMAGFPYICNPEFLGAPTGASEFADNVVLENDGDVATCCKVIIKANGAVTNPKIIINNKYVRIIDTMVQGDEIEVDFTANPPTVTKNGRNFIGHTDRTSSFIGMELAVGDTIISYDADDGTNLMSVSLYFNKLYWTM